MSRPALAAILSSTGPRATALPCGALRPTPLRGGMLCVRTSQIAVVCKLLRELPTQPEDTSTFSCPVPRKEDAWMCKLFSSFERKVHQPCMPHGESTQPQKGRALLLALFNNEWRHCSILCSGFPQFEKSCVIPGETIPGGSGHNWYHTKRCGVIARQSTFDM